MQPRRNRNLRGLSARYGVMRSRGVGCGGSQPTLSAALAARRVMLDRRDPEDISLGARQPDANGLDSP
jgi:hypothetical protein